MDRPQRFTGRRGRRTIDQSRAPTARRPRPGGTRPCSRPPHRGGPRCRGGARPCSRPPQRRRPRCRGGPDPAVPPGPWPGSWEAERRAAELEPYSLLEDQFLDVLLAAGVDLPTASTAHRTLPRPARRRADCGGRATRGSRGAREIAQGDGATETHWMHSPRPLPRPDADPVDRPPPRHARRARRHGGAPRCATLLTWPSPPTSCSLGSTPRSGSLAVRTSRCPASSATPTAPSSAGIPRRPGRRGPPASARAGSATTPTCGSPGRWPSSASGVSRSSGRPTATTRPPTSASG